MKKEFFGAQKKKFFILLVIFLIVIFIIALFILIFLGKNTENKKEIHLYGKINETNINLNNKNLLIKFKNASITSNISKVKIILYRGGGKHIYETNILKTDYDLIPENFKDLNNFSEVWGINVTFEYKNISEKKESPAPIKKSSKKSSQTTSNHITNTHDTSTTTQTTTTPTEENDENNQNNEENQTENNAEQKCSANTNCSCPQDVCIDYDNDGELDDYEDYPEFGNCSNESCDVSTENNAPCEPNITISDNINCPVNSTNENTTTTPCTPLTCEDINKCGNFDNNCSRIINCGCDEGFKCINEICTFIDTDIISLKEGERIYKNKYFILNDSGGNILKLVQIINKSLGYNEDIIKFKNALTSEFISAIVTNEGSAEFTLEGKIYNFNYFGPAEDSEDTRYVIIQDNDNTKNNTFYCDYEAYLRNEVDKCDSLSYEVKKKIAELKNESKTVVLKENEKVYQKQYLVIDNGEGGEILKVSAIFNNSEGYSYDSITLTNILTDEKYNAVMYDEGIGSITIHGKIYDVSYSGAIDSYEDSRYIKLKKTGYDKFDTFYCDYEAYLRNEVDKCDSLSYEVKKKIAELKNENKTIILKAGNKIYVGNYAVLDDGKILKLIREINQTIGYNNDQIKFLEEISGDVYEALITGEGNAELNLEGKIYQINYFGSAEDSEDTRYVIIQDNDNTKNNTFYCDYEAYLRNEVDRCDSLSYDVKKKIAEIQSGETAEVPNLNINIFSRFINWIKNLF